MTRPLWPPASIVASVKLVSVCGIVLMDWLLEVEEGRWLSDILIVSAPKPGFTVIKLLAGVVAVIVVIVVKVAPVSAALAHVLVVKEPGEALVGDRDPGGGLGLAKARSRLLRLLRALQPPLRRVLRV